MRFATISMTLFVVFFLGLAIFSPEPRLPGSPTESEYVRENWDADHQNWLRTGATLPMHTPFMVLYYVGLGGFTLAASAMAARLLFRRHRGGRARAVLVSCNFPLLLGLCAGIFQTRYLHFMCQYNEGTHLQYVHQLRFSLLLAIFAAALPACLAAIALRLAPGGQLGVE
jgi:hypothetical protein